MTIDPHWTSFVLRPPTIGRTAPQNFSQALFDETLSSLPNNKAPGPDQICNEWLKNSPQPVRKVLFACLQRIWDDNLTLPEWLALSKTILLFKPGKDDPTIVKNYRPIALANTIYKLYTKMVASIIQTYAESNSLIDSLNEGSRAGRNTTRQVQYYMNIIQDAHISGSDLFSLYIDFSSAFNTIGHAQLFFILEYYGYPTHIINAVKNIYMKSSTTIQTPHGPTEPVPNKRGTIQGDTLSPLIFIIFMNPLIQCIRAATTGYIHTLCHHTSTVPSYVDDLVCVTHNRKCLQEMALHVYWFAKWGDLEINVPKCALTALVTHPCTRERMKCITPMVSNFRFNPSDRTMPPVPILQPHESYKYLGIYINMLLDWSDDLKHVIDDLRQEGGRLLRPWLDMRKKLNLVQCKLLPAIRYHTQSVPFSDAQLGRIASIYTQIVKQCIPIQVSTDSSICGIPRKSFGLEAREILDDLHRSMSTNLISLLRDESHIGLTTKSIWTEAHRRLGSSLISLPDFVLSSTRSQTILPILRQMNIMYSHLGIEVAPTWDSNEHNRSPTSPLLFDLMVSSYTIRPTCLTYSETWALQHLWNNGLYHLSDILTPDGVAIDLNTDTLIPNSNENQHHNLELALKIMHLSLHNVHLKTKAMMEEEAKQIGNLRLPPHLAPTQLHSGPQYSRAALTIRYMLSNRPFPHPHFVVQCGSLKAKASYVTAEYTDEAGIHQCVVALQPLHHYVGIVDPIVVLPVPGPPIEHLTFLKPQQFRVSSNDINHPLMQLILLFRRRTQVFQLDQNTPLHPTTQDIVVPYLSHPPNFCDNVDIAVEPVNPDKDMSPTYAASLTRSSDHFSVRTELQTHIYNSIGRWMVSIPNNTITLLWHMYSTNKSPNNPSHDSFLHSVLDLAIRYNLTSKSKGPLLRTTHKTLPKSLTIALYEAFSCSVELFSSPLDLTTHNAHYYSSDPADAIFQANHNAYSWIWRGSVFIHPPNNQEEMQRAFKWALLSTQHSTSPVFCVLALPFKKGAPYTHYLNHKHVHILLTFPPNSLRLTNPYDGASNPSLPPPPTKSAYVIIIIANQQGYSEYYSTSTPYILERYLTDFTHLSLDELHFSQWTFPQLASTPLSPRPNKAFIALFPPKRDVIDAHVQHAPGVNTFFPMQSMVFIKVQPKPLAQYTLCFPMTMSSLLQLTADQADLNIYTDGSYSKSTGVAQAGVFVPHIGIGFPYVFKGDQNAQFAERIGLAAGISTARDLYSHPETIGESIRPSISEYANIYTDNLGNIQLFKRWLRNPHSMRHHPHRPLFEQIALVASQLPCTLRIRKVVSHTGVRYNEAADATADEPKPDEIDPLELMGYSRATTKTFAHSCGPPNGWCLLLHASRWPMPKNTPLLYGKNVPGHLESFNGVTIPLYRNSHVLAITTYHHIQRVALIPRVVELMRLGNFAITTETTKWPNLLLDSPVWNDVVTDSERRQWLKGMFGRFFCNNSPGHPQYNQLQKNMCPVCLSAPTSFTHVSLECSHPTIHSLICARHNDAVISYASSIRKGTHGGFMLRTDAGKVIPQQSHIEDRWTIHPSILRRVPQHTHTIPDIVHYTNVYTPDDIHPSMPNPIRLIEVAYSGNREAAFETKFIKYAPLVNSLRSLGHNTSLSILTSDVRVPITHLNTPTFESIGIHGNNLKRLRRSIWLSTIQYLNKIIVYWRTLESAYYYDRTTRVPTTQHRRPPWGNSSRPSRFSSMSHGRPPD